MTIEQLFSEPWKVEYLPYSICQNCKTKIKLYEDKWHHVFMSGGQWYFSHGCEKPQPIPCSNCGAQIDYKTTDPHGYKNKCSNCIADYKEGDKIGIITMELRQAIEAGNHKYLKFGTSCSVVITPRGIFFEDIS